MLAIKRVLMFRLSTFLVVQVVIVLVPQCLFGVGISLPFGGFSDLLEYRILVLRDQLVGGSLSAVPGLNIDLVAFKHTVRPGLSSCGSSETAS